MDLVIVRGMHMHIGSGTDLEHLTRVAVAVDGESTRKSPVRTITTISAGGGLPIRYQDEDELIDLDVYYARWDEARKRLESEFGHAVQLEIEPGRFLVAESGYLVAEIRAIKQMGQNQFYVVDAGFNNLARPILYGAYHPISIAPLENPPSSARFRTSSSEDRFASRATSSPKPTAASSAPVRYRRLKSATCWSSKRPVPTAS